MSNQDQQPPWGQKKKPQTPEEMVAQLIKKLQDFFSDSPKKEHSTGEGVRNSPPPNPFAAIGKLFAIVLAVLVLQSLYSSFYKISPSEVGVILRLGKYNRTSASGLHFKIPYIDTLYKVNVEEIRKEEFGFRSRYPGQNTTFDRSGYDMESLMLTADKNVINVAWIVQYRVKDPQAFLFKIKDVRQAVRDISESITRRIVGNMDFDYVLSNRDLLAASVKQELQDELNNLDAGVSIGTVQFQDINPPDQVKPAFNEVNEADQDMKRLVNEAEETYNRVIPKARGSAKQMLEEAHGYAVGRVNDAKGETARFRAIFKEYKNFPEVTKKRMYLETMQEIMPAVESIYIMDENQQTPLPLLNLSKGSSSPVPFPPSKQ
ncbi:MAG: FtsH protease activity modulator HflK [Proteobacteria bacterium]|nr:FtsH protease activity modulator HflK [Pseudomonadota bacterium]MBU1056996.1 FtsH protease activity modulator HflK [Pseudomonadota bacterium]